MSNHDHLFTRKSKGLVIKGETLLLYILLQHWLDEKRYQSSKSQWCSATLINRQAFISKYTKKNLLGRVRSFLVLI